MEKSLIIKAESCLTTTEESRIQQPQKSPETVLQQDKYLYFYKIPSRLLNHFQEQFINEQTTSVF